VATAILLKLFTLYSAQTMLTEQKSIDQIIVNWDNTVSFREVNLILKDGQVVSRNYHRSTLIPACSLADVDQRVAAICALVWTDDVIATYLERARA
jgi:hypothetical protein